MTNPINEAMWAEMAMLDPEVIKVYDRFVPDPDAKGMMVAQSAVVIQDREKCYIEYILGGRKEDLVTKVYEDLDVDSVCAIAKQWAEGINDIND